MLVILILGYLSISVYFFILLSIPYSFVRYGTISPVAMEMYSGDLQSEVEQAEFRRRFESQMRQKMLGDVVASLSRIGFGQGNFSNEAKCVICMCEYQEEDLITQLECDPTRHFFHTSCLEQNIQIGNDKCPFCRA
jgi:hypothetical protein